MYQSGMMKRTVLFFPWVMEKKALAGESAILCKERQKIRSEDLSGSQIPTLGGFWPKCQKEKKWRHTEGDLSCVLTLSQNVLRGRI